MSGKRVSRFCAGSLFLPQSAHRDIVFDLVQSIPSYRGRPWSTLSSNDLQRQQQFDASTCCCLPDIHGEWIFCQELDGFGPALVYKRRDPRKSIQWSVFTGVVLFDQGYETELTSALASHLPDCLVAEVCDHVLGMASDFCVNQKRPSTTTTTSPAAVRYIYGRMYLVSSLLVL